MAVVAVIAVVAALAACATPPPIPSTPLSPDEAIGRTVIESGIEAPRAVLRVRGWVLVAGTRGPNDVLLLLSVASEAPWTVSVVRESAVRASDPATLSYAVPEDTVYLFGLVSDPRIASVEVVFFDGGRTFGVTPPGYLVTRPGAAPPDPIQSWRFLDAAGAVIFDPEAAQLPQLTALARRPSPRQSRRPGSSSAVHPSPIRRRSRRSNDRETEVVRGRVERVAAALPT